MAEEPIITVNHLDMGYGSFVLMRDLNFTVNRGDIFIIMGGSGCGKSTLLKILIGLKEPSEGKFFTATGIFGRRNRMSGNVHETVRDSLPAAEPCGAR